MSNDLNFDYSDDLPDDDSDALPAPLLRIVCNLLVSWALCDARACRRAHCCKGDPDACLSRCVDQVSEEVWAGAWTVVLGHLEKLSFEQALAKWPAEFRALNEWKLRLDPDRRTVYAGGMPRPLSAGPATSLAPAGSRRH